jgi:solute carrier family 50 (sugar transporter)
MEIMNVIDFRIIAVIACCMIAPTDAFSIPGDPTDAVATTVSYIGLVSAFAMFLSPVPTMQRIIREKDITFFSENNCLVTGCGCVLWTGYAIATPDRMSPLITNLVGLIIQGTYCLIFLYYTNESCKFRVRFRMCVGYTIVSTVIIFAFTTLQKGSEEMIPDFTNSGQSQQTVFLGLVASAFNVGVYAAPLSVMRLVIATKNAEFMPLPLTLMGMFGSVIWSFYGTYVDDIFICVPNYIGVILSALQLSLIMKYRKPYSPSKKTDDVALASLALEEGKEEFSTGTNIELPPLPGVDIPTDGITVVVEKIMDNLSNLEMPPSPLIMASAAGNSILETIRELTPLSDAVDRIKENFGASPRSPRPMPSEAVPEYEELIPPLATVPEHATLEAAVASNSGLLELAPILSSYEASSSSLSLSHGADHVDAEIAGNFVGSSATMVPEDMVDAETLAKYEKMAETMNMDGSSQQSLLQNQEHNTVSRDFFGSI